MNSAKEMSLIIQSSEKTELKIQDSKLEENKENQTFCEICKEFYCLEADHNKKTITQIKKEFKYNINSGIDLSIVEKYLKCFDANNPEILKAKISSVREKSTILLEKKFKDFKNKMESKILKLQEKLDNNFNSLNGSFIEAEKGIHENNIEVINNITSEEILEFFNKKNKTESGLEDLINLVKKNSDQDKIKKNLNEIETILYCKMLSTSQKMDYIDLKVDDVAKDINSTCSEFKKEIDFDLENPSIYKTIKNMNFFLNPKNFVFKKDITDKLQKSYTIDGVFCAFTTYDGKSLVAWGSPSFTVEIYDLVQEKVIKSLTGHIQHIYITRHFFDKLTMKDYLLTTSYSKCCKVWDLTDFSNILTLSNCHNGSYLYSGLIIFDPLNTESPLVLTVAPNENIKVWNFKKSLVSSINASTDYTYYLNVWYDDRFNKNDIYIINANSKDVKIYDYRTGKVSKTFYKSDSSLAWHMSAFVEYIDNKPYLFESDGNGNLKVWDVDTQAIFKKITISGCNLRGICLWNDIYVLAAGTDKSVKIINYMTEQLEGTLEAHNNILCTIEKINHPIYGETILTGAIDGKMKLFAHGGKEEK